MARYERDAYHIYVFCCRCKGVGANEPGIIGDIGKIGTTLAGVEGGYTLGLESGFKAGITGKGVMKDFIKLETSLPFK